MNENDVAGYYDKNTKSFLRRGQGGKSLAIHRAVWAPGVCKRTDAFQYINERILQALTAESASSVLDLGCGVGGSLLYLASRYAASYAGITRSAVQAKIAQDLIRNNRMNDYVRIVNGDFADPQPYRKLALQSRSLSAAFAVESFIHAGNPQRLAALLGSFIAPRGFVIICDDMLNKDPEQAGRRPQRLLEEYRRGWHVKSLLTAGEMDRIFSSAGFCRIKSEDFTPYLELDRPRDMVIRLLVNLFRHSALRASWWENMLGGNALQLCLKNGVVKYKYTLYRKS
jgi:cyclopropane fatty-acyl-phospholipid synthase-like methyltransferase